MPIAEDSAGGSPVPIPTNLTTNLTGEATGSGTLDYTTGDIDIVVTVVDNGHNHILDNITDVQVNNAINGQVLKYNGNVWVNGTDENAGITAIVQDLSPQLGGNLDLNNRNITGTGNLDYTGNITLTGTVDGRDVSADGTKLDGIESGATADQTAAQIKTAYESNSNTNAFTDADHTKLDGIETAADVTDTTNVVASLTAGTNVTIAADGTISATGGTSGIAHVVDDTSPELGGNLSLNSHDITGTGNLNFTGNVTLSGTVDGRDVAADGTKLDGIETGATTDQTAAEILTAIKTVDGSGSGLDADTLDGVQGSNFLRSDTTDYMNANLVFADNARLQIGTNTDLQLYHDGTNSYIKEAGTGDLLIRGQYIRLQDEIGTNLLVADGNDAVSLYYGGASKLATTSSGIAVSGDVFVNRSQTSGVADLLTLRDASAGVIYNFETYADPSFGTTNRLNYTGQYFAIRRSGTEQMRFTSTGIDVTGNVNSTASLTFGSGGAYEAGSIYSDANWGMIHRAYTASPVQADHLFVNSAGTERMRIDAGGIDVTGKAKISASATLNAPSLGSSSSNAPLYLTNNDTNYGLVVGNSSADGHVWLQAQRTDGTATAYNMTLNEAGGNVGIGTAVPSVKLQTTVANTSTEAIRITNDTDAVRTHMYPGEIQAHNSNLTLNANDGGFATVIKAAGAERMRVNSSGIDVTGATNTTGTQGTRQWSAGSAGQKLGIYAYDNSTFYHRLETGNATNYQWGAYDNIPIYTITNNTIRTTLTGDGKFGVGTTAPKARAQFTAGGYATPVLGSVPANASMYVSPSDTAYGLVVGMDNVAPRTWLQSQHTNGASVAYPLTLQEAGGNVGVGTSTTNNNKAVIEGGVAATNGSSLALKSGGGSSSRVADLAFYGTFVSHPDTGQRRTADITSGYSTGNWGTEYLAFGVGTGGSNDSAVVTTERMRISGNGNVGVGITAPTAKMHLFTDGIDQSVFSAQTDLGSNNRILTLKSPISDSGTAPYRWQTSNSIQWEIDTAETKSMQLSSAGNLGIGTYACADKLHVEGNVYLGTSSRSVYCGGGGDLRLQTNTGEVKVLTANGATTNLITSGTGINIPANLDVGNALNVGGASAAGSGFIESTVVGSSRALQTVGNVNTTQTHIGFENLSGEIGRIDVSAFSVSYVTSSDYRLKTDIQPMQGSIDRVKALKPCNFEWVNDGGRVDGFIAHEAQEVVPEAISGEKNAMRDQQYVESEATGDIYTPAVDATYETIQVELTPAVDATYDDEGNELTSAVDATYEAQERELTPAIDEVIYSSDVVEPDELEEGQLWRETTQKVMATRQVPDYQGIDQSKIVPLLTSALQDAIAKIEALETRLEALES